MKELLQKFLQKDWMKDKNTATGAALAVIVALFLIWQAFFGFSPANVKLIDTRITFKFTAYHDIDQNFVSYTLENKTKTKLKVTTRVQLGETRKGGRRFKLIKAADDKGEIGPRETKTFVAQVDVPKAEGGKARDLAARAKVKRVSRA